MPGHFVERGELSRKPKVELEMTGTSFSKWGDPDPVLSMPVLDTLPLGWGSIAERGEETVIASVCFYFWELC